jgi:RNA polymerase sigma-70 factor (ECF subfamily)
MNSSDTSSGKPGVSQLLDRARQGDAAGRDELFAACRNLLHHLARAHVESAIRAKVDASDIIQETMLEAHRDFSRFQGRTEGEWVAWLRRILSRNAADFIRRYRATGKRNARREVSLKGPTDDSQAPGAPEPAADDPTPSQIAIHRDHQLRMAEALTRLPPDYREVVMLRNLQRLPFDEVAQRMNRSRPAAQMLWMRAIRRLQELLEE